MQAQVTEADEVYDEAHPRTQPLWFWAVPLLLLLICAAVFVTRHRTSPFHESRTVAANTLPELGRVQFDSGKPTLTPDGQATLDRAADAMHGNPNVRLRLEDYDPPRVKHKKKDRHVDPLNLQRDLVIETYLDTRGIERARLSGGKFAQLATEQSNGLLNANADSRRVELYAQ